MEGAPPTHGIIWHDHSFFVGIALSPAILNNLSIIINSFCLNWLIAFPIAINASDSSLILRCNFTFFSIFCFLARNFFYLVLFHGIKHTFSKAIGATFPSNSGSYFYSFVQFLCDWLVLFFIISNPFSRFLYNSIEP